MSGRAASAGYTVKYDRPVTGAERGIAVIVVSSELEEVLGLSHRILVMSEGRQQGILSREDATPERVMSLAVGGDKRAPEPNAAA